MEDQKHMPADNRKAKTQSEGPAAPSSASAERARLEGVAARRHARRARAYIALVMVALAATLGAATYAWFTSNMKVNTNSVSVHSDTSKLVLELGDADRGSWSQQGDASLASTANGAVTLYPVSTFDLNGFAACVQNNSNGDATVFEQAKDNGSAFYHGWIDLRPTITGTGANKVKGKVSLYLAESLVPQGADAELLRAARVGIKISSGSQVLATNIFELDSSDGGHRGEHPMTRPGWPCRLHRGHAPGLAKRPTCLRCQRDTGPGHLYAGHERDGRAPAKLARHAGAGPDLSSGYLLLHRGHRPR